MDCALGTNAMASSSVLLESVPREYPFGNQGDEPGLLWQGSEPSAETDACQHLAAPSTVATISVVVPMYNAVRYIGRCLDALARSSYRPLEVIVVDDGSTDGCAEICRWYDVELVRMPRQSGPAAARNVGIRLALGDIVVFVDSDVEVKPDTLASIRTTLVESPDIDAVFGSYDDAPAESNFVSQFKNLHHHHVHQSALRDAATFWAGCGAIRTRVARSVGGFDAALYTTPSIEDIELGYRLRMAGCQILVDRHVQVKHLKRWTLQSWLRADILRRAVPWSLLILRTQTIVDRLNTKVEERGRAVLAVMFGLFLLLAPFSPFALDMALSTGAVNVAVNGRLLTLFYRKRGIGFAAGAFFALLLYYVYSCTTFVVCCCLWPFVRRRKAVDAAPSYLAVDEV